MPQKNLMQIKEFARLTGIRAENLRFYDQIGLLTPEVRGDNGYRYYSRRQLNAAYLIGDLRDLGVGLEEIKRFSRDRTPEGMLALFERQEKRLQDEIQRLHSIRDSMRLHGAMAREALRHGERDFLLEERSAEPIFLCEPAPSGLDGEEGVIRAYEYAAANGVDLSYPFGAVMSTQGDGAISRYYFKTSLRHNGRKPDGLFAVAYGRCELAEAGELYAQLRAFMLQQGLRPRGDGYGECPLGEMAVQDAADFCVRVEIPAERDE